MRLWDYINEGEMDRTCSMRDKRENAYRILVAKPARRKPHQRLGTNGKMIKN
jgi:hypothetical protein